MKNNKNIFSYIIAGAFFLPAISEILGAIHVFNQYGEGPEFRSFLLIVASILMGISILIKNNVVLTIGVGGTLGFSVIKLFYMIGNFLDGDGFTNVVAALLVVVAYVMLLLAARNPGNAKKLCVGVVGLLFISNLVEMSWWFFEGHYGIDLFLSCESCSAQDIALYIGVILFGFVYLENNAEWNIPAINFAQKKETDTITNKLDEVTKLKALLDSGIITQEEFDEKKKQVLGL